MHRPQSSEAASAAHLSSPSDSVSSWHQKLLQVLEDFRSTCHRGLAEDLNLFFFNSSVVNVLHLCLVNPSSLWMFRLSPHHSFLCDSPTFLTNRQMRMMSLPVSGKRVWSQFDSKRGVKLTLLNFAVSLSSWQQITEAFVSLDGFDNPTAVYKHRNNSDSLQRKETTTMFPWSVLRETFGDLFLKIRAATFSADVAAKSRLMLTATTEGFFKKNRLKLSETNV